MNKDVEIDYTNYKGERAKRTIRPHTMYFGSNEWHKEEQWLLYAWDYAKVAWRTFAMKDIHTWVTKNG